MRADETPDVDDETFAAHGDPSTVRRHVLLASALRRISSLPHGEYARKEHLREEPVSDPKPELRKWSKEKIEREIQTAVKSEWQHYFNEYEADCTAVKVVLIDYRPVGTHDCREPWLPYDSHKNGSCIISAREWCDAWQIFIAEYKLFYNCSGVEKTLVYDLAVDVRIGECIRPKDLSRYPCRGTMSARLERQETLATFILSEWERRFKAMPFRTGFFRETARQIERLRRRLRDVETRMDLMREIDAQSERWIITRSLVLRYEFLKSKASSERALRPVVAKLPLLLTRGKLVGAQLLADEGNRVRMRTALSHR